MPDKYGPISSGVPTQAVGTRDQPDVGAAEDARIEMQKAAACDQFLLRQKDDCIRDQKVLIEECRHRLLNCLQMVVALLSLQSRKEEDGAAAKGLAKAADRVQVIAGLHHHLHSMDGAQMVEFKSFLDRLCRDHSAMLTPDTQLGAFIVVAGVELDVPATIGLPLSLIANELVTNAIKHGGGLSR
jgi:two-component sensor histidine kinase